MTPNAVPPTTAMRLGCPKLARLKRLNASTRSCKRVDPVIRRFVIIDRSVLLTPGPYNAFLPRLRKWNTPLGDFGSANTELDVHEPAMLGSHTLLLNHWVGDPMMRGSPTRSGRSVLTTPV